MKTTIKLLFFAAIFSIISSCGKDPYKLLQQKNGTWTATSVTTIDGFGTFTDISEITFLVGSATIKDTAGHVIGFNWAYDKKASQITLTSVAGNDIYNTIYNVSAIEKDSEKWTFESQNLNDVTYPSTGYSKIITLKRK